MKLLNRLVFIIWLPLCLSLVVSASGQFASGNDGNVGALLVQPDGKLLVGGSFYSVIDYETHLLRYNTDASLDTNLVSDANPGLQTAVGAFTSMVLFTNQNDNDVEIVIGAADGVFRMDLAGNFKTILPNGPWNTLYPAQLGSPIVAVKDGIISAAGSGGTANSYFYSQPLGASYATNFPIPGFAVLNPNYVAVGLGFDANKFGDSYSGLMPLDDHTYLLAGGGTQLSERDDFGHLITGYSPPSLGFAPRTMSPQVLDPAFPLPLTRGGNFEIVGGTTHKLSSTNGILGVARLNNVGNVDEFDPFFQPAATDNSDGIIYAVAGQGDGRILVGGDSLMLHGPAAGNLLRLNWDGSLDTTFQPGLPPGFVVTCITVVSNRAYVGMNNSGSAGPPWTDHFGDWRVYVLDLGLPNYPGTPTITTQPQILTKNPGDTALFLPVIQANPPLTSIQWYKQDVTHPIANATNITLQLSNVGPQNAGNYFFIATNTVGSVTSMSGSLTVLPPQPPVINGQPQPVIAYSGGVATFSVDAYDLNSSPLTYQWQQNGIDLPGHNSSQLFLSDISDAAAGQYDVIVSNAFNVFTVSSNATLTVLPAPTNRGTLAPVHTFSATSDSGNNADGVGPNGLILGRDGFLYGTTSYGGANGFGVVFRVGMNDGSYQVLYSFTDGIDGAYPVGLVMVIGLLVMPAEPYFV